jgi:hypothetical protein
MISYQVVTSKTVRIGFAMQLGIASQLNESCKNHACVIGMLFAGLVVFNMGNE